MPKIGEHATLNGGIKRMFHPIDTDFFKTLGERIHQKLLRTSAYRVFWSEDSPHFRRSFIKFVHVFLDNTEMTSKHSALIAYPVHVVPFNFSKEYMKRMN